ncbi:hypothetical protein J3B02_006382, partial [Coemansia erecta]
IVLDSSDESDQAAKSINELDTRIEYSASFPQHTRRDEAVALHSSDEEKTSGVEIKRCLKRARSESTSVSNKGASEVASVTIMHVKRQTIYKSDQSSAIRNDVESVVSIDGDSQGLEIVTKQSLERELEKDPQMLVPESPELTPVPLTVSEPVPVDAIDFNPTAATEATLTPTPLQTPVSKQGFGKTGEEFVPGLVSGTMTEADLDFAFSMPSSQTSVRDSRYLPEKPQASIYLDAQEHVVQSIAGLLDNGSRAGSAGPDERQTPERLSYLKIFDRILNAVLRFESHLFSEHEREVLMT